MNYILCLVFIIVTAYGWRRYKKMHTARESKNELESIVYTYSNDGMFISDENGLFLSVNPAFEKLTGYNASEIVNKLHPNFTSEISSREFYTVLKQSINLKQSIEVEISDCRIDGSIFYKLLNIQRIIDQNKQYRYIGVFSDMTKIEEANQKLWYQANFDTMTDLPNRNMFFEHLQRHIDKANRYEQQMALLYMDLTNFEEINNQFGHQFGDLVLKQAVDRIVCCLEDSDLLYRIGGVEFTIIMPSIKTIDQVNTMANKILKEMTQQFTAEENKDCTITANIGISISPDNGLIAKSLLDYADHAMYISKKEGKNTFSHYKKSYINPFP